MLRPLSVVVLPAVLSDHGLGRVWWTGGRVFRCAQLTGARCAAAVAAHAQGCEKKKKLPQQPERRGCACGERRASGEVGNAAARDRTRAGRGSARGRWWAVR